MPVILLKIEPGIPGMEAFEGLTIAIDPGDETVRVEGAKRVSVTHVMRGHDGARGNLTNIVTQNESGSMVESWVVMENHRLPAAGHFCRVDRGRVQVISGSTETRESDVIASWPLPTPANAMP